MKPVIHNVKASVKLKGELKVLNSYTYKDKNFFVIRQKYTYIIFKKKGGSQHVNITKIPCIAEISQSVQELKGLLAWGELTVPVIDNLTATLNLGFTCNLSHLYGFMKDHYKVRYSAQKFPSLFWKLACGTALVFATGKVILVGHKTLHELEQAGEKCLSVITKRF